MNLEVFKDRLPNLDLRTRTYWECALGIYHVDGYGAVIATEEQLTELGFWKKEPPGSKIERP